MARARGMQVRFGATWPPGSGAALRAVAPAGSRASDILAALDLPGVALVEQRDML